VAGARGRRTIERSAYDDWKYGEEYSTQQNPARGPAAFVEETVAATF
jgi:hypothetical protein